MNDGVLEKEAGIISRDLEHDRLGINWKSDARSPSEPATLGSQIRIRTLCDGENMCRWKFRTTMQCPRCHAPQEDKQHILTCPAPIARDLWEKSLKALEIWLRDEGTDLNIRENLMHYLRSWPLPNSTSSTSLPFLNDQDNIGTQYLWDGWLCQGWREYQDQIWKQSRSRKSS